MIARFCSISGPLLTVLFTISQSTRDVYFAKVFQDIGFFEVILLAFPATAVVFAAFVLVRRPGDLSLMGAHLGAVVGMNLSTAVMWIFYFFALQHLEPSIVNTLFSASMLVSTVIVVRSGIGLTRDNRINRLELRFYSGIAAIIVSIWAIVTLGWSGTGAPTSLALLGLILTTLSGVGGCFSGLLERRLNEYGVAPETVIATRFILVVVIALAITVAGQEGMKVSASAESLWIVLAVLILIVVPTWIAQWAVATTSPITLKSILALGPLIVFGFQQIEGRLECSTPVLILVAFYAIFVVGGNLARGWKSDLA